MYYDDAGVAWVMVIESPSMRAINLNARRWNCVSIDAVSSEYNVNSAGNVLHAFPWPWRCLTYSRSPAALYLPMNIEIGFFYISGGIAA